MFQSREIRSDDSDVFSVAICQLVGFEFQSREIRSDDSDVN